MIAWHYKGKNVFAATGILAGGYVEIIANHETA